MSSERCVKEQSERTHQVTFSESVSGEKVNFAAENGPIT